MVRDRLRAFSLIELLVVTVVICILAAVILPNYLGGKTMDGKKIRAPIVVARDSVCQANLRSVRQAIDMAKMTEDGNKPPADLSTLKLPSEVLRCEVGGEAYVYNKDTGEVHCPHPGHEAY